MVSDAGRIRRLQKRARASLRRYRLYHEKRIKDGCKNIDACWDQIRKNANEFNMTMEKLELLDSKCPGGDEKIRLDPDCDDIWAKPVQLN